MKENEYREQIDKALQLRDGNKTQEFIAILTDIIEEIPAADIKALTLVGSLLREGNELSKASYCFDKAAGEDPIAPRVSMGLFHSLWRLGRYDEAFDELERFFSVSESEAHFMLLADMREGFFEEKGKIKDPINLIMQLREDLSTSLQESQHL